MSLHSGKQINIYEWQELPIDDDVINRVEEIAEEQNAAMMTDGYPMFEWMPGVQIDDENDTENENEIDSEEESNSEIEDIVIIDENNEQENENEYTQNYNTKD